MCSFDLKLLKKLMELICSQEVIDHTINHSGYRLTPLCLRAASAHFFAILGFYKYLSLNKWDII